jgi:25S rRNA (uracil2634-N3)-methyltransferase
MPKKKSLQAALANQQFRLKKQSQLAQAVKLAERKKEKVAITTGKKKKNVRATIPLRPTDKILLIGEGNFSFAYSLVVHPPSAELQHLPPQNVTASAYDTEEECLKKYNDAGERIQVLREKGVKVLFSVDATNLEKCSALKGKKWDKVVWNFPHAGWYLRSYWH